MSLWQWDQRKSQNLTHEVNVKVTAELYGKIQNAAMQQGKTIRGFIRELLEKACK